MSRLYIPKVTDLVQYRRTDGRWVGAVVTAVIDAFTIDIRISHAFVREGVARMSTRADVNVWDLSRLNSGTRDVSNIGWDWRY